MIHVHYEEQLIAYIVGRRLRRLEEHGALKTRPTGEL